MGNLIASLDVMLRVALIPCGLINHCGDGGDKLCSNQRKRFRIRGGLVENQRPYTSYVPYLKVFKDDLYLSLNT